jgi:hypothetical protein
LQLFNLWREDPEIKKLVLSKRLAQIATALIGVKGVRLYHNQALFKEAGGSSVLKAVVRITFWGTVAMGLTALVGYLFNVNIA